MGFLKKHLTPAVSIRKHSYRTILHDDKKYSWQEAPINQEHEMFLTEFSLSC